MKALITLGLMHMYQLVNLVLSYRTENLNTLTRPKDDDVVSVCHNQLTNGN